MTASPSLSEAPSPPHPSVPILSVSELNGMARMALEKNLPLLWVAGEISNLTRAASGHIYFILKDANSQVRCTIWRNKAQLIGFRPENGQKVEARALVTLYEARGEYQLNVETLRRAGQGLLFERFLALKATLEAEGLFTPENKRQLPFFPRHIAIVTSPQAAALKDVLITLERRAPHLAITLFPTPVQGEGAALQIATALKTAAASGCEAIILCRGGGSLEDLWAFNEEEVVRAIRASSIPVVSGVGHETDFTLADFAADLRAPTPTSAAEQICPDRAILLERIVALSRRLEQGWQRRLGRWGEQLDYLAFRLPSPARQIAIRRNRLTLQSNRLHEAISRLLAKERQGLERLAQSLRQLSPEAVLARGYAIAFDAQNRAARDASQLTEGEILTLRLAEGSTAVAVVNHPKASSPQA
ncbi:MAG: exodeoxyribonuclease VII large subunit [Betaproteobacteria bacterium]|nr:exodeoxyribonuclease VII large subunit [Betaproteobacteria bacterium]